MDLLNLLDGLIPLQCDELYVNEASAATAVHNGEGLIEFGFYSSD
ncbi:unnamed protein product [marine sediment metagenome]|uniref:Uncharacterized protein n=1 Tax=marine sediment metagenome TaxID=412755 RepID=X1CJ39_9ZZZZ